MVVARYNSVVRVPAYLMLWLLLLRLFLALVLLSHQIDTSQHHASTLIRQVGQKEQRALQLTGNSRSSYRLAIRVLVSNF